MAQTFVLVHGTWHGGWLWRDVARALRAQGHRVFTPTCTGCGEREHLSSPDVGLNTHILDIEAVIATEELEDVILVGHSFAGITITAVADRMKSRLKRIIYFDALAPKGDVITAVPKDPDTGDLPRYFKDRQAKFIDGYKMVFWEDYPVKMLLPETEVEHVARLKRLISTHPARQWTDEYHLQNGGWQGLNPVYIHCVGQAYRMSSENMVGPARGPGWTYLPLDIPRNGMMTHPQLVADTLASYA
ncbi:MAG: alpha/beta fold hydrolase [Pseudomonadota bacterium]